MMQKQNVLFAFIRVHSWPIERLLRLIALAILTIPVWPQNAPTPQDAELARAAKNPYDIARFVDSHLGFDWNVLWNALGIKPLNQPCGDRCAIELITVFDPEQVIVLFQEDLSAGDVYLRFLKKNDGTWRFSGAYSAYIRNHPRRHEVTRTGGKPFLRIWFQGPYGSLAEAEMEDWFDLTQADFKPVFSFARESGQRRLDFNISRNSEATIIPEKDGTINVVLQISFYGEDADGAHNLGVGDFSAVYSRPAGARQFTFQTGDTSFGPKLTRTEFEELADFMVGPSNEDLIRYDLPGLKQVATGNDSAAKSWLKRLLSKVRDTPEVRELKALLK